MFLLLSTRLEKIFSSGEVRNSLDTRWSKLVSDLGFTMIMVANDPLQTQKLVSEIAVSAIILTGGGNLSSIDANMKPRDEAEEILTKFAVSHRIPLIGICRGAQFLGVHFGGNLAPIKDHVGRRHNIIGRLGSREVNSFHEFGFRELPESFEVLARDSEDMTIEAFRHRMFPMLGLMWHPEREVVHASSDLQIVREFISENT